MGGSSQRLSAVLPIAAVLWLAPPPAALACGYHDDVSMARGMINWVYPDALHVFGAMSAAVADRRLPAGDTTPDLFGSRYRRTAEALEQLGRAFPTASRRVPALSFSLVLLEPMLWTRFEAAHGRLGVDVHVTTPEPGDLVLVSGEAVIGEVAAGRLAIGEALRLGLIRLYGSESQKAEFIGAYHSVGGEKPAAGLSGHRNQSTPGHNTGRAAMRAIQPQSVSMTALATPESTASEVGGAIACGPAHH